MLSRHTRTYMVNVLPCTGVKKPGLFCFVIYRRGVRRNLLSLLFPKHEANMHTVQTILFSSFTPPPRMSPAVTTSRFGCHSKLHLRVLRWLSMPKLLTNHTEVRKRAGSQASRFFLHLVVLKPVTEASGADQLCSTSCWR